MSTQPIPVLTSNTDMQAWYAAVLTAARKIDPGATLSAATGMATITIPASGAAIQLTAVKQQDARYGVTPDELIQSELTGKPIVLSPAGIAQSRADQIAALVQVRDQAGATPTTQSAAQTAIDQLQAFWTAQDEAAKPKPPAPAPTPAASDAWVIGSIITEGGKTYEVRDTPFGAMKFLVKNAPVAPASATVASERADYVAYIKTRLLASDDANVQAELVAQLTWLSKRS